MSHRMLSLHVRFRPSFAVSICHEPVGSAELSSNSRTYAPETSSRLQRCNPARVRCYRIKKAPRLGVRGQIFSLSVWSRRRVATAGREMNTPKPPELLRRRDQRWYHRALNRPKVLAVFRTRCTRAAPPRRRSLRS